MQIPTIAVVDTDSDPDLVDIVIPANDDSFRSIEVIVGQLARAIEAGQREYKSRLGAKAKIEAEQQAKQPAKGKGVSRKELAKAAQEKKKSLRAEKKEAKKTESKTEPTKRAKKEQDKPIKIPKKKVFLGGQKTKTDAEKKDDDKNKNES